MSKPRAVISAAEVGACCPRAAVSSSPEDLQQVQRGDRRRDDGRGQRVREEVRPGPLAQHLDDLGAARGVAAGAPAQRLAEGAGDDVHPVLDAEQLGRAAPGRADEADGVRVVDHHQRVVRSASSTIWSSGAT